MDLFVAEHIEKNFANHRALDDVSVNISENSIFGASLQNAGCSCLKQKVSCDLLVVIEFFRNRLQRYDFLCKRHSEMLKIYRTFALN